MKTKCEIEGCPNPYKYKLYRTLNGIKKWIRVCVDCEKTIGDENLRRMK